MKYIIAICIFQALAGTVLLLRSNLRNRADGLLIMLLVCIGIHLSIKFAIYTFVKDIEVLTMMNTFINFCYVPLLYLYTVKTIRPQFVPASQWYVFIPFIISTIGFFSVISVLLTSSTVGHNILYWYNIISLWMMILLDFSLACWIVYIAKKHLHKQLKEKTFIIQIASIFIVISLLSALFFMMRPYMANYNYVIRSIMYTFLIVISIKIISYSYVGVIDPIKEDSSAKPVVAFILNHEMADTTNQLNPTYNAAVSLADLDREDQLMLTVRPLLMSEKRKELLSADEMLSIVLKLETAMTLQRCYRDSELTLDKLAVLTEQNKYHISESLNHFLHKSFYTFVNEYRVQHVKDRLERSSKKEIDVNMLTLAYDAGFNSKSSFNRYFKEIVGQTPSSYFKIISQDIQLAN